MRELKFRAWNDDREKISPDYIDREGVAHWKENSIPQASTEVEQYTGLKDKNGVEIYEGDILKLSCPPPAMDETVKVYWHEIMGAWYAKSEGSFTYGQLSAVMGMVCGPLEVTIIGNIHETPELVEVK